MMSKISLPPRFVMMPAQEVYDRRLDDEHFRTLAQIRGLAYKTRGERTPVLTMDDLVQIRGVDRATIYRHLAALRKQGYIRTDRVGKYQFVIFPLRWEEEASAALPADDEHQDFTDEEAAALFGADEKSRTDATDSERSRIGAIHHDDVVVPGHDSSDSDSEGLKEHEHQQHDFCRTDATDFELRGEIAGVLTGLGMRQAEAQAMAAELIQKGTPPVCRRQLSVFDQRCTAARLSKRGLENPVGLLRTSILEDWPLPEVGAEIASRTSRGTF